MRSDATDERRGATPFSVAGARVYGWNNRSLMEDVYETLLFDDSPTDQPSVRRQLDDNPALARAWAHWCAVRGRIHDRLQERDPGRRLLVLYALDEAGHGAVLTAEEHDALAAAREDIERALEAVPALEQVVERIQEDQEAFKVAWARETDGTAPSARHATNDETRAADRPPRRSARRSRSAAQRWTRRLAVAALVVGAAVLATLYWSQEEAVTTVTVDEGETRVVDLADGSTVRLVGGATLSYPTNLSDTTARRVTLRNGRAFFDVVRRADGPEFSVETPSATATVLGTQFGVLTGEDTTAVVLAEGRVNLGDATGDASPVALEPGQRSRVAEGESPAAPTTVDLTTALDWTGLFVFRSTPMSTLVDRLQRHYEADISVASALQDESVSGTFEQDQSVQEVLRTLAKTLNADVQSPAEGQYRIVPVE